jgi:hypothetical protein
MAGAMTDLLLGNFGPIERLASTPVIYLVLWSGLVALSIGFIVLLRTGWGQSRPLGKCALLSLLVHVLLACAAMTVKIVAGGGDAFQAGPIRVHIVDGGDGPVAATLAVVSPQLFQPPSDTNDSPSAQKVEAAGDAQAVSRPAATETIVRGEVAEATPQPTPVPVETSPTNVAAAPVVAATEPAPAVNGAPVRQESSSQPPTSANPASSNTAETRGTTAEGSAGPAVSPAATSNPYGGRTAGNRMRLVESQGGNVHTETAVVASPRLNRPMDAGTPIVTGPASNAARSARIAMALGGKQTRESRRWPCWPI